MTIGQEEPDKFKKGQRLTAAALNSIVNSVVAIIKQMFGPRVVQPLNLLGKMDAELAPATAFEDDPATAAMSVWAKDAAGDYVDTTRNITVVNRFENVTIAAGTIVKAEWIDGEWQLYASDCEAN